jgi:hypothetical protein
MPLIAGDKSEKVLFVAANFVLAIIWMPFLFRLTTHWSVMEPNNRASVGLDADLSGGQYLE